MAQLSDDCFAFGGNLLGIDAAREMIFERVQPVVGIEPVPLRRALGRTLAEDVTAPIAVPGFDNSAVDGYAMRFDDLDPHGPTTLRCVDRIARGPRSRGRADARAYRAHLHRRRAARGRRRRDHAGGLPARRRSRDHPARHQARAPTRGRPARTCARGSLALKAGRRLGPAELGVLAALGLRRGAGAPAAVDCAAVDRRRGARARRAARAATRSTTPTASCWPGCWSASASR